MSLGGLAIAIGELVDDAIIDLESVVRRLRENSMLPDSERMPALEIVFAANREIRGSVVFATFIVTLVFLPLFALESVEGRLLWPLGFAYTVALAASLIVALTVTPALCSILLPKARSILKRHEPWLIRILKRIYRPSLSFSLDHPWLVLGSSALLLCVAGIGVSQMGRPFLLEFNEGASRSAQLLSPAPAWRNRTSSARHSKKSSLPLRKFAPRRAELPRRTR
jgi:Cu/Ag efflux pump CusA